MEAWCCFDRWHTTLTASSHPCARLMQCIKAVLTALNNQDKNPNLRNCHSLIEYLQSGEQGCVVSAGCALAVCESHPSRARGDHSQNQQLGTGELLQPLSRGTCCAHSALTPLWQKQTTGTTLGVWKYMRGSLDEKWQFLFCLEWSSTCS